MPRPASKPLHTGPRCTKHHALTTASTPQRCRHHHRRRLYHHHHHFTATAATWPRSLTERELQRRFATGLLARAVFFGQEELMAVLQVRGGA